MSWLRKIALLGIGAALLLALPAAAAPDRALPAAAWWLVLHDQCADMLHWISPTGEFASMPRPTLPNEAPGTSCGARALHISQDGRYLAEIAALNDGRQGVGFYDLETGQWLAVHETEPNEFALLGGRYSSGANHHLAVGFATDQMAPRAWRVIIFDMSSGQALTQLRSSGPEIGSFVGGETLATAETLPYVTLLQVDETSGADGVHIRFDAFNGVDEPLGALVWYPGGAPGLFQKLLSGPYSAADLDVLPDGQAILAYENPSYPPGPAPEDAIVPVTTNAIGVLRPPSPGDLGTVQLFYADGLSTLSGPRWGADGRMALFRRYDGTASRLNWITVGTAVLIPLTQEVGQVIGVPNGFVFSTADGIYYVSEDTAAPTGPVFSDPALSGSMAFVWASAFGDPPLALTYPAAQAAGPTIVTATPIPGPLIVTATPDTGICRIRSADAGAVNIRSGPDMAYPVIGQLASGSTLDVIGYNGQWYVVNYSGMQGWMAGWVSTLSGNCTSLAFISPPAPPPATPVPTPVPTVFVPGQPDLYVSEFSLDPGTPTVGQPVNVRVGVYNQGDAAVATTFHVEWWPGENYSAPACAWDLDSLAARGGRILTCTYAGYPSAYASINTMVVVDSANTVGESSEGNNVYRQGIQVNAVLAPPPGQPDLYVSEFGMNPATPTAGSAVNIRLGVYNQGAAATGGPFTVGWWPGENYGSPACTWTVDPLPAHGGQILTCVYGGYPSPYASINTMVVADTGSAIAESNEGNNTFKQPVTVN